ncbi:MAG: Rne/Rng family ribonuclease [Flavobacteriales bacterium]|nr:Rne/Rng family ribonuclease [Flavobacteriales bacterium]
MNIELVINARNGEVDIAVMEDKVLVELHKQKSDSSYSVGDIYLGRVRNVVPSLNACFVNVGHEKDAFLHYLDLGPQFSSQTKYVKGTMSGRQSKPMLDGFKMEPDINKGGKINERVSSGQNILVQIAKEPISTKGPRLTTELTLAGRYIVLVPFSKKISISSRVKSRDERNRLTRLMKSILPPGFGVIIRTVAVGKKVADLDSDLRGLIDRWKTMHKNLQRSSPPKMILGELNKTSALLRDILSHEFTSIHVNDEELAIGIKSFLAEIEPDKEKIVKHYSGKVDIFDRFGIYRQIKSAFGRQVNLKSGGYLIVEHTEAMHVIDVNSGNRKPSEKNQEQNALETNMECAKEIARILKLRDMGGIIVIDFIDMQKRENRKALHEELKRLLKQDKAKSNVLAPSRFGLVEITRQRVRPETDIKTSEKCPTCNGSGEIEASILLTDDIENMLEAIAPKCKGKELALCVHPYIESYLTKNHGTFWKKKNIQKDWSKKYGVDLNVRAVGSYTLTEFRFFDTEDEEVTDR